MIALAVGESTTKVLGSDKLLPRVAQMLDGWKKANTLTAKKLPVEADLPEYKCCLGTSLEATVGDLTTIAFYYLICVGEYTCKGS
jgi:hypothetical protein